MKKGIWEQKVVVIGIIFVFCSTVIMPLVKAGSQEEYPLPPPLSTEMLLEESIFRRMSVREFTNESVTDEELSTILWAACGYQTDGGRTIAGINNTYSGIIYVLKEDAAYTYNPVNHSLVFFKAGDWRDVVGWQYKAPIQLGLCYDKNKADSNFGGAELGQIGQNIQFMANALNLGTVVCGQTPPAIEPLGIPDNEEGMIVMPLGHMIYPYNFKNRPLWFSTFPRIQTSSLSLTKALDQRTEGTVFSGTLTKHEVSQFLWCTYGFSPFIDRSDQEKNAIQRHRTVPSAHGYYPLEMYAVTEKGIYYYQPNLLVRFTKFPIDFLGMPVLTYMLRKITGDHRLEIAQTSAQPSIASAPLIILSVLNLNETRPAGADDLSAEKFRRFWYFEAGASAHNVLLEATAWNLSTTIVLPTDALTLRSVLKLDENYVPLFIIPVGH
jgi:nitroreductase